MEISSLEISAQPSYLKLKLPGFVPSGERLHFALENHHDYFAKITMISNRWINHFGNFLGLVAPWDRSKMGADMYWISSKRGQKSAWAHVFFSDPARMVKHMWEQIMITMIMMIVY